jgi:hypothetical protein
VSDVNATLPEVEVTAPRDSQISPDATVTPASQQARSAPRLSRKRIDVTFIKGSEAGKFAESGTDTVKLSGLRVSAQITKAGANSMGEAHLRIWGMTLSKMNDLSTLGMTVTTDRLTLNNTVIIEAGDDDAGMSVVFHGTVFDAWVDPQGMPDVAFHVTAKSGLDAAAKAVPPTSYRGIVDVATVMAGIAELASWGFQNNGVTSKMEDVYYPGTAWDQMIAVKNHAHINAELFPGARQTLIIWPNGAARDGQIPLINKDTGMIGYPAWTAQGIVVTTKFNPAIGFGQKVKVETDLKSRNPSGVWIVQTLLHELDAEVPHGSWQSRFEGLPESIQTPQVRPGQ